MRCRKAQRKLEAMLGGELSRREHERVDKHLARCAECAAALRRLRRMRTLLAARRTPPVPDGFQARLLSRARERTEQRSGLDKTLRRFGRLRWAAAAAGIALALAVGVLVGRDMMRPAEPPLTVDTDPALLYGADYLTEAPAGSLAGAYVDLVSTRQGE